MHHEEVKNKSACSFVTISRIRPLTIASSLAHPPHPHPHPSPPLIPLASLRSYDLMHNN
jgi:hypothetical protein